VWRVQGPQEQLLGRISKIQWVCKGLYCQVVPPRSNDLNRVCSSVHQGTLIPTIRRVSRVRRR
jgi:hypothetical protein